MILATGDYSPLENPYDIIVIAYEEEPEIDDHATFDVPYMQTR